MAHLTAGDLHYLKVGIETTYGTEQTTDQYYGDIKGDGGSITITDTPTPYIAWRNGDRSYNINDCVAQQKLAGFKDVLEVCDQNDWNTILTQALGTAAGTTPLGKLPSRTVRISTSRNYLKYIGCKTDELVIKGDAPGAVVTFEETVLASRSEYGDGTIVAGGLSGHAVQWVGAVTINGTAIYPQSFMIRIKNNLERVLAYDANGSYTAALLEGRREIEVELEVWREDFTDIENSMDLTKPGNIVLTLGTSRPKNLVISNVSTMSDGNISPLLQDKQRTTLRFRAGAIAVVTPSA